MPASDFALLKQAARKAGVIALRHFRSGPGVWDEHFAQNDGLVMGGPAQPRLVDLLARPASA